MCRYPGRRQTGFEQACDWKRTWEATGRRKRPGTSVARMWTESCSDIWPVRSSDRLDSHGGVPPSPPPSRGDSIRSLSMGRLFAGILLLAGTAACAAPRAAGAPLAPVGRSWAVPTLGLYQEWWDKTVACSGKQGKMTAVNFYAVDAPGGAIELNGEM